MDETPVIATLSDDAAEAAQNITTLEDYQKVRGALVKDSADARFKDEGLPFEADPPTDDAVVASTPVEAVEPDAVETSDNPDLAKEKKSRPPRTGRAKTAKARIDKIVWEREEARKEVEQLRHQLQSIQAPAAKDSPVIPAAVATPSSGPVSPDAPTTDVEPLESSYAEYGEFVTAKARWAARQEVSKAFQDAQQHQDASLQQQYYADRVSSFAEKMARGSEHDPEFLAKVPSEILNLRPARCLRCARSVGSKLDWTLYPTARRPLPSVVRHSLPYGRWEVVVQNHKRHIVRPLISTPSRSGEWRDRSYCINGNLTP